MPREWAPAAYALDDAAHLAALRSTLAAHAERVAILFACWDNGGDGGFCASGGSEVQMASIIGRSQHLGICDSSERYG